MGCKTNTNPKSSKKGSADYEHVITEKQQYHLIDADTLHQTRLSNQFDLFVDFKRYTDTIEQQDSCFLKVYVKDKITKLTTDSISFSSPFFYSFMFQSNDSMTSYSTQFKADREIFDNYFGDIVVTDFNFDGKDDIAVVYDGGGNGGPEYNFYTQTDTMKFVMDKYLTDSVVYFPNHFNKKKNEMVTLVHAGACCVGKHVYRYEKTTKKWKQISHKIIGI